MAEVTEAQIQQWKKKYGDVYEISVKGKRMFVRPPGRNELGYVYQSEKRGDNIFDAQAVVLNSIYLGGDKEIINDDRYFMAAVQVLEQLMDFGEAKLKKY